MTEQTLRCLMHNGMRLLGEIGKLSVFLVAGQDVACQNACRGGVATQMARIA